MTVLTPLPQHQAALVYTIILCGLVRTFHFFVSEILLLLRSRMEGLTGKILVTGYYVFLSLLSIKNTENTFGQP